MIYVRIMSHLKRDKLLYLKKNITKLNQNNEHKNQIKYKILRDNITVT